MNTAKINNNLEKYPELTVTAVLVGYLIGALLAVSIGYASLILGFSIEGSELAAILGFGILRGLLGRKSIIENNINQTVASAVNGASAGMMFSVPAIFILGFSEKDFSLPIMVLGCIAGGIMGIAFIIPLRKQMIDFERLAFPGGIAVATILKSPGAGIKKAYLLLGGALVSALVHAIVLYNGYTNFPLGEKIGLPWYMNVTFYISLLTIGVAFLAGKGGFFFIIGGYTCYFILAPILNLRGKLANLSSASDLQHHLFRPIGIGMLIGGALMGIVLALPLIIGAIRSMYQASKSGKRVAQDELPIGFLGVGIIGAFVVLLYMSLYSAQNMTLGRGVLVAILGTIWIWVAGVILSECIGRTNWSPLSGMTLIGVTLAVMLTSGLGNKESIIASIMVGAAMCVAMSQATDLMLDLKTGYLVGAIPRKQQIAQFLGSALGPIIVITLIVVLHKAYTLGSPRLPAPQGQALASMIEGILNEGIPKDKYIAGAGIGALLSATGIGGLGILVGLGFYLPFNIVLTYTIGTVLRIWSDKKMGKNWSDNVGVPIAAGAIVGEALIGVGFAIYHVIKAL